MPTGSVTPAGGAAFNGGTITQPLTVNTGALATAGGVTIQGTDGGNVDRLKVDFPHTLFELTGDGSLACTSDDTMGINFGGIGTPCRLDVSDTQTSNVDILLDSQAGITLTGAGSATPTIEIDSGGTVFKAGIGAAGSILTSPAAPATKSLSSGTGAQMLTTCDVRTSTPVTFNPTAGAAATCAVAVSLNGVAYVALWTETEPAGVAFDGTIHGINVYVPASWYLRLTVVNATIGTTTYY